MRYHRLFRFPLLTLMAISTAPAQPGGPLGVPFAGRFGQVEVGGPYAGVEFHGSRPLPSRISFYAPVANSIDVSTDYWKRGDSRPMAAALRVNGGAPQELGKGGWAYTLAPHTVRFTGTIGGIACAMTYEFCNDAPGVVYRLLFRNMTGGPVALEAYTHLRITLRSCQTYARFDSARTESREGALLFRFDERALGNAVCFVQNAGLGPASWTTGGDALGIDDRGGSLWFRSPGDLRKQVFNGPGKGITAAAFVYRATLGPGDSIAIVQIIGSGDARRVAEVIRKLPRTWRQDVGRYNARIEREAFPGAIFSSGDPSLDRSAAWARGILAANAHYIDGRIVPMPCPAEYNFFFTHDLLLTDLAAVRWDTGRVRRDLGYVAALAKDSIIPHAYYWRDSAFVTEYCTPDSWNHPWFVIAAGTYLRHSGDVPTVRTLYPLLTKSIKELLRQRREDHLMYGFRPDWWDIGHVDGARAYLTILTTRALREYVAISVSLPANSTGVPAGGNSLLSLETIADSMQQALQTRLWDPRRGYLMEKNSGQEDPHIYMGPLVAAVFGLLDDDHARRLVATAGRDLLDPRLGIRTVTPTDFHSADAIAAYHLAGEEAGRPYFYINGGVWPHANAWYVVALARLGRAGEALDFMRRTMSLDGLMASPQGHPAMFEYRYADTTSPMYGSIDKPSFLWAGGFYMYALYSLLGVDENEWNISLSEPSMELARARSLHPAGGGGSPPVNPVSGAGVPWSDSMDTTLRSGTGVPWSDSMDTTLPSGTGVPWSDSMDTTLRSGTGVPARGSSRIDPGVRFPLAFGTVKDVRISPSSSGRRSLVADGRVLHTLVMPLSARRARSVTLETAPSGIPILLGANALLEDVRTDKRKRTLSMLLSSFPGHAVSVRVATRTPPSRVSLAGKPLEWTAAPRAETGWSSVTVRYKSTAGRDTITIAY